MGMSLKAARTNAELSRPAVIKRLKDEKGIILSVNTLASYEKKATQPDVVTAMALASIYNMSVNDIIFL